jgi:trigger factor
VTNYARETLKREDDAKRIADKILEEKVNNTLREIVKLETRKVSIEEFNRLFEQ